MTYDQKRTGYVFLGVGLVAAAVACAVLAVLMLIVMNNGWLAASFFMIAVFALMAATHYFERSVGTFSPPPEFEYRS